MQSQEEMWLLKEKYHGEKTEGFFADVALLKSGTPLAYVIGSIPFLGTTIHLDTEPLIPRPETEFWTEKAINEITKLEAPKVLDLCAGSGAIGVAVAAAIPNAHVTLAELEKSHLSTIGKNLDANNISCTRYKVFQSDLFENISGQFDFILTNPPYIDPELDRTEASVKDHEPHSALYGGHEGLELIAQIIAEAPQYLTAAGQLWIEHEPEQVAQIAALAKKNGLTAQTHTDQYNTARYSVLTRSALE